MSVSYEDIDDAIIPCLRHRLLLNFQAEAENVTAESILEQAIKRLKKPRASRCSDCRKNSRRDFLARLEKLRIRTRQRYAGLGQGMHLSPKRGSSLEFNDFRHYSPGDDFRYIDWGLYGRSDKLYIKLFKEEEDLLTYIFIDASASMGFPAARPQVRVTR